MKMMSILFFICFSVQMQALAQKSKASSSAAKFEVADAQGPSKAKKAGMKPAVFPAVPALKENEYAVFLNEKYSIFTTQKVDDLELDSSCVKTKPVKCQAYLAKDIKPRKPAERHEGLTNLSAYHCDERGGENLIAVNSKREEFNFCRFKDGSMVNSWSLYFKEHPIQVIK